MALFQVQWKPGKPNSSHWYTLNGVITYTSGALKDWEGGDHKALVRYLHRRGFTITQLDPRPCVPPTLKYHKQLKDCVDSLLTLLPPQP